MAMKAIIMKIMNSSSYNENNEQQHIRECFANSCYKIVLPIPLQELINDFDVCKHYSGTLLLVEDDSHGFEN